MSTGADCRFTELAGNQWQYELQRYPYGETEKYDAWGPFATFTRAVEHLQRNHSNPGGWSVRTLEGDAHKHDFQLTDAQVPVGVTVEVRIESLGPEPTLDQVVARLREITSASHYSPGFFHVRPAYAWKENVLRCASCDAPHPGDAR